VACIKSRAMRRASGGGGTVPSLLGLAAYRASHVKESQGRQGVTRIDKRKFVHSPARPTRLKSMEAGLKWEVTHGS
jgi:hypothetical protein